MRGGDLLRAWAPPTLLSLARRQRGVVLRFTGRPAHWQEALAASSGYDDGEIVARVAKATRAVIAGQARFERDSVLFDELVYPFEILAALLRAAALNDGRLDVIDFGGSMGSTYRQCRPFLEGLRGIRWQVVEQPAFVELARREFSTNELTFRADLPAAGEMGRGAVVLASSVLQYLESPSAVLLALASSGASHLVIDRTTFTTEPADRLCIQHAPKHVYEASYPCWLLSKPALLDSLAPGWRLLADFPCTEGSFKTDDGARLEFRGLILEAR